VGIGGGGGGGALFIVVATKLKGSFPPKGQKTDAAFQISNHTKNDNKIRQRYLQPSTPG